VHHSIRRRAPERQSAASPITRCGRPRGRRAELITAFRSATWLGAYDQAHAEARVQLAKQMAAVLVVRRKVEHLERLELHGL